jgi:hypothetical protein
MHFGRRNPRYEYEMDSVRLEEVEVERDIGVTVSNDLKPSKQCVKAAATARAVLGQITRAFHFRDRVTFVQLFKTYVRLHLRVLQARLGTMDASRYGLPQKSADKNGVHDFRAAK